MSIVQLQWHGGDEVKHTYLHQLAAGKCVSQTDTYLDVRPALPGRECGKRERVSVGHGGPTRRVDFLLKRGCMLLEDERSGGE